MQPGKSPGGVKNMLILSSMSKGRLDGDVVMTGESRDAPFSHSSAITVSQQCYLHRDMAKYIPCLLFSLKLSLVRILLSVERGETDSKRPKV